MIKKEAIARIRELMNDLELLEEDMHQAFTGRTSKSMQTGHEKMDEMVRKEKEILDEVQRLNDLLRTFLN